MRKSNRGFTLIELLIVVAIIGILAAIAIPNFLEAQTRAKVARVQTEIKGLGNTMEMFFLDHNSYIISNCAYNMRLYGIKGFTNLETSMLTSPIAYITSIPIDVFSKPDPVAYLIGGKMNPTEGYCDEYPYTEWVTDYVVVSKGPDKKVDIGGYRTIKDVELDEFYGSTDPRQVGPRYDPTNGTVSAGDIILFGLHYKGSQGYYP